MHLVEAFRSFEVIRKSTQKHSYNTYTYYYEVKPKEYPVKISPVKWFNLIQQLQQKFPDKSFRLDIKRVKGRLFYILRRKGSTPVYYEPKTGRIFVPKSYVKRKYRLVCHNLHTTLYNLGVNLIVRKV